MKDDDYLIYIGDDLIGFAKDLEADMPWIRGKFEPAPLFAKYQELFDRESQLSKDQKWEEREKILASIYNLGLRLESPARGVLSPRPVMKKVSGGIVLFHIRGNQVSWRPT